MLIKAFSVRSLERNLSVGSGSNLPLPFLKKVSVVFGKDTCPAKPALSSFYVNELPRIYHSNPHITFTTAPQEADICTISLTLANDKTASIDLRECASAANMFRRIISEINEATGEGAKKADA